jgi:hypothetical protein
MVLAFFAAGTYGIIELYNLKKENEMFNKIVNVMVLAALYVAGLIIRLIKIVIVAGLAWLFYTVLGKVADSLYGKK